VSVDKEHVVLELRELLGENRILSSEEETAAYGRDMTEAEGMVPVCVAMVRDPEEVKALLLWANRSQVPVTPSVARTNLGGLAIPAEGGVVMDLTGMNRIIEVNEEDMYAVVEPGVTFGQMKEYLDTFHPGFRMGYPLAPPESSVLCNCLLDGLGNLSLRHGAMGDWINGLEAVLPTGEAIKAGSSVLSPFWFGRVPVPDIVGLFTSWQGTTGVVTKLAVQLWPQRCYRDRFFLMFYSTSTAIAVMRDLCRWDLFDDMGGLSWPTGKMSFGVALPQKDPNEPEFFLYLDYAADTRLELWAKRRALQRYLRKAFKRGLDFEGPVTVEDLLKLCPEFQKLASFPTRLDFLLDAPGGGLTWVGTYGPMSRFLEGFRSAERVLRSKGRLPIIVARPMKGGHFGVLRFISLFQRDDPAEVGEIRQLNRDLAIVLMDQGFIPYKAPRKVVDLFMERIDPGYADLIHKVKKLLDPQGIMNPGKWI